MDDLNYCEGCETENVQLNAMGYCDECVQVAVKRGNANLVGES